MVVWMHLQARWGVVLGVWGALESRSSLLVVQVVLAWLQSLPGSAAFSAASRRHSAPAQATGLVRLEVALGCVSHTRCVVLCGFVV